MDTMDTNNSQIDASRILGSTSLSNQSQEWLWICQRKLVYEYNKILPIASARNKAVKVKNDTLRPNDKSVHQLYRTTETVCRLRVKGPIDLFLVPASAPRLV